MRRRWYSVAAVLMTAGVFATALGTDAPHTPDPVYFEPDSDDPFYDDGYCGACHKPHGATGGELWASGTTVNELCEHCHTSNLAQAPKPGMEMMTHMAVRAEPNCDFCVHTFEVTCTSCHEPHAHEKPYEKGDDGDNADMFLRTQVKLWKLGCGDSECGAGEHHGDLDKACTPDESCTPTPCTGLQTCELNPSADETICVCPIGGDGACTGCLVSTGVAKFQTGGDGCMGSACTGPGADCGYGVCVEECSTLAPGCTTYHVDIGDLINPKDWNEGDCVAPLPTCTENGAAGGGLFDVACWGPAGVCQTTPIDGEPYCDCPVGGAGADCRTGGAGGGGCAAGFDWNGTACVNHVCVAGDEAGGGVPCGYGANCDVTSVCQDASECDENQYWDETLGTPACIGFDSNVTTRVLQGSCAANPCPAGALACTTVEDGKGHICECPVGSDPNNADCGLVSQTCAAGFVWSAGLEKCVPDCGGATEGDPCGYGGGCTGTCPTVAATCGAGEYYDDAGGACVTNETCAVGVNCFNGGTCDKAPFDNEYVCNCPPGTTGADCAGGTATEGQGCDASRAYVYSGGACVVDCVAAGKVDGNACGFGGQCKDSGSGGPQTQRPTSHSGTGTNLANAYDTGAGADTTFGSIAGASGQNATWTPFSAATGCSAGTEAVSNVMIYVDYAVTGAFGGGQSATINSSAGTVQNNIKNAIAKTTASLSATTITTCGQIADINVSASYNKSGGSASVNIYDIRVTFDMAGGGGLTCDADYGTAGCETGYTGTKCDACNGTTHFDYGNRACQATNPATTCGGCGTGTCWDDGGVGVCDCPDTYEGAACDTCGETITLGCQKSYGDGLCTEGYDGTSCDACAGTHVATPEGMCVSSTGSNGPTACSSDPCFNGTQGTCARAANGTAMCVCNDKYDGTDCNTCTATNDTPFCNEDKGTVGCDTGYTSNGGYCNDCAGGYTRYADGTCKITDPCASVTCQNGGTCYVDSSGVGLCDCPGRYTGDTCQNETGCAAGTTCACDQGYVDGAGNCDACDTANYYVQAPNGTCVLNPCRAGANPCKNGSSCYVGASGDAECDCSGQFYGPAGTCELCTIPATVNYQDFDSPGNRLGLARGTGTDLCEVCHTATVHFQAADHPITPPSQGTETWKATNTGEQHAASGVDLRGKDCVGCHIHKLTDAQDRGTLDAQGSFGFVPVAGATNVWRGGAETAPSSCAGCHLDVTAAAGSQDVDSYQWNGTKSMIDGDEWSAYGHGVAHGTTYPSGNTYSAMDGPSQAAFAAQHDSGCEYCHDKTVPHNDPDNFFRLRNVDALQRGVCGSGGTDLCFDGTDCSVGGDADCSATSGEPANDVCNVCHLTGGGGYDPDTDTVPPGTWAKITSSLLIDGGSNSPARHFGTKHTAGGKGGRFCWDCHDPHGDLSADATNHLEPNFFMIQRRPTIDHRTPDGLGRPYDPNDDDVFPSTIQTVDGLALPVKFDPAGGTVTTDTCDVGGTNECNGSPAGRPCTTDAQCNWDLKDFDDETSGARTGDRALCRGCHLNTSKNCWDQDNVSGASLCASNDHPESDGTGGAVAPGCVQQCHPHALQFAGQASADQNCYSCHAKAMDADVNDYGLGGNQAKVNIDEFGGEDSGGAPVSNVGSGHGRAGSSYPSGNAAAAFTSTGGPDAIAGACYYCHTTDPSKAHPAASSYGLDNPFMLAINEACGDGSGICGGNGNRVVGGDGTWNDICLRCHSDSVSNPGYDPPADGQGNDAPARCTGDDCVLQSLDSPTATTAHTHATANTNGVRCWHCHDPHGDGNNYMIHLNAFNNLAPSPTDPCKLAGGSGCGGEVPINSANGDANGLTNDMSFAATATPLRSDYLDAEGAGTGPVCGQCHPASVDYCNQTSCSPTHQSSQGACTNCHEHDGDFQGVGNCITCHGDTSDVLDYSSGGTRGLISMTEWRDTGHGRLAASGVYGSNNAAANFAGSVGSDGNTEAGGCYYCHLASWDPHPQSTSYAMNNPFLLRGSAGNDVCNACHASSGAGVNPAADFQGHDAPLRCDASEKSGGGCKEVGSAHAHGITPTGSRCWHCHDPHGDGNDYMIQLNAFSNLAPDDSDPCNPAPGLGCPNEVPVNTTKADGAAAGLTVNITFLPGDPPASAAPYTVSGAELCGSCHQHAVTGSTAACNQDACTIAPSGDHAGGAACTGCHSHSGDFAGEGDCIGCHTGTVEIKGGPRIGGTRRAVGNDWGDADPGWQSHHVRKQNGATLTVHDCVMCHAEGYSNGRCTAAGGTECSLNAVPCQFDKDCVSFNTTKHKNRIIDLRNVDSTTPHNATTDSTLVEGTDYFAYNKDSIAPTNPASSWNVGKNGPWSSANSTWVTQTSTKLDPFCLTCHDADGAAGQATMGEQGALADPLDPFNDTVGGTQPGNITNITDQQPRGYDRMCTGNVCDFDGLTSCTADASGQDTKKCGPMTPAVVDVASMVTTETARVSLNKATGTVQSQLCILYILNDTTPFTDPTAPSQAWRCASNPAVNCTPDAYGNSAACGNYSPRNGYYSRHAIRSQATSVYTNYQYCGDGSCERGKAMPAVSTKNGLGPDRSIWYATAGSGNATPRFVDTGNTPEARPEWNDQSVMSCADCHTTDGANDANGNAHGAKSEYLLKDRNRSAEEGLADEGAGTSVIICYQCHDGTATYVVANAANHAHGNTIFDAGGAKPDPTTLSGSARATTTVGTIFGIACTQCHGGTDFGAIHGSSQNIGSGVGGAADDRGAYRFMNGAGMRYYSADSSNVANWRNLGTNACYTVASADTFGGCVVHGSKGPGRSVTYSRPLQY